MESPQRLIDDIVVTSREGRLELPSLPDIAGKIHAALKDENNGHIAIARIIQFDPALTARLIKVANSPRYRVRHKVEDCVTAITRLGLDATRNIVTSFVMRNLFCSNHSILQKLMTSSWEDSTQVAAISFVLADITIGLLPDRAMLAGLLHNIGVLPVVRYAEAYPELIEKPGLLAQVSSKAQGRLGTFILKHWDFDRDLAEIPRHSEDWLRDTSPVADYADVVMIARIHNTFGKQDNYTGPPLTELPAFRKLPLGKLGPSGSIEVLNQAQKDIDRVLKMLKS
ncbi:MAG: HDOD domain-containing protein [Gammaproteobacteria bacterium]|nr:MAG: HDOD domain-containing protein [Gammaproteobacteria bacterium]